MMNIPKIDVQLVSDKVNRFINENFIDRLVVYFAGHGIVRSLSDQFWLFTDAANDIREGIDVEAFKQGLLKCNIGTHNAEVDGQLCLIGDACRNVSQDVIDFHGDPIVTRAGQPNDVQLDQFLSTGLGQFSLQVDASGEQSAYCLFSEVLLTGLSGDVVETIEAEHHQFKPAITNHRLANYLEDEVEKLAAECGENMKPDIVTGIRPPYNVYRRVVLPLPSVMSTQVFPLSPAIQVTIDNARNDDVDRKVSSNLEYLGGTFGSVERTVTQLYDHTQISSRNYFLTVCDFPVTAVAASREALVEVVKYGPSHNLIFSTDLDGAPILVQMGEQWTLVPHYPGVVAVISGNSPGDIWQHKRGSDDVDTSLSDFSSTTPLRAAQAQEFADKIRRGKHQFPHQSVTAGYLYKFSNDYDNIARTAHYMARNLYSGPDYRHSGERIVPFDLALLCATKLEWRKDERGLVVAAADLPAVEESPFNDGTGQRPPYTRVAFEARQSVRLWGLAPIFHRGWRFMQTEQYLEIPETIRQIGANTRGRSATSLMDKGVEMFLDVFNYRIFIAEEIYESNS